MDSPATSGPERSPRFGLASPAPLGYRPGLDGVRGLAVAAVFLYHADVSWIPGGFLGVDTFFVLSGYLITALLVSEWWMAGSIAVGEFWKRRARRLLPAAYALLTGVVAVALVFRDELARVLAEVPSAIFYVYNWMLVGSEQSYFESMGRPSPLRHLWSLAVEEQFYLLWPLLALWALRRGGRRRLIQVAAAGAVLSVVLMTIRHVPGADPSSVYYGTDARAIGLLLGAAAAIVWHPGRRVGVQHRLAVSIAGLIGLGGLIWLFLTVDEFADGLYPGGFVLVALASVVVAVAAADTPNGIAKLMGVRPLRWLGTRSYSIYLWHWPVVVFTRPGVDLAFDGVAAFGLRLAATLALAEISYRLVEARFRWSPGAVPDGWEGRPPRLVPRGVGALVGAGALASVLALAVAVGWVLSPVEEPPVEAAGGTVSTPSTIALADFGATSAQVEPRTSPPTAPASTDATIPEEPAPEESGTPSSVESTTSTSVDEAVLTVSAAEMDAERAAPETTTTTAVPSTTTTTTAPAPPTVSAVGDSVMAGAVEELQAAYPGEMVVDAVVSRSIDEGIDVIARQAGEERLGDVVVVHLGTNGPIEATHVSRIMETAGPERTVAFVTVRLPRRWEDEVNEVLRAEVPGYDNAVLVDWHAASDGERDWFAGDGIHIQDRPGAAAYAEMLVGAIGAG